MTKQNPPTSYKKAFTLTELLIVVSILTILGTLIIVFFRSQIFKGNDAKRKSDIKRIQTAVEEYEKDNDCYPITSQVVCTGGGAGLQPYLNEIPCDPETDESYYYENEESSCPKWYRLYSSLENEEDVDYKPGIGPNAAYNYVATSPNAPRLSSEVDETQGGTAPGGITFYGCFRGVCRPISQPYCQPKYGSSTCYGACGTPQNPKNQCLDQ